MPTVRAVSLAWVESPLQLVGAVEFSAATGARMTIIPRDTGPQMASTAREIVRRGLPDGVLLSAKARDIPWSQLRRHQGWLLGDALSGQARLALARLRPERVVLVDDGAMTLRLADAFSGRAKFARPNVSEGPTMRLLGRMARSVLRSAQTTLFTYHHRALPPLAAFRRAGGMVEANSFTWVRRAGSAIRMPQSRVLLGTARVVDGLMTADAHLGWVRAQAAAGPVVYLPHRRETDLDRVAAVPGVQVVQTGLPVELALAGTDKPLEIVSLPSSAVDTLRIVLAGTGSTVSEVGVGGFETLAGARSSTTGKESTP
ncbi:hypothetical protein [Diaminobutyricimonas sp. LJ205]|uniref:hypothetical protein n=1 Tax=Diaminobutyricimonas sp. LJ205 TaxID=2683590 RepID=UPI0012F49524|nr:hypothetical protein [Diaminobutyricimonas sp. LJ205]